MAPPREFIIQILFEKDRDGRVHVHSPQVAGLHLAGRDLNVIRADLEPILKDLLFHNLDFVADKVRWIPSLEEVVRVMTTKSASPEQHAHEQKFLMITERAA